MEAVVENGRFPAHIRGMTGRDYWTETLTCPKCGKIGNAYFSQANGKAYADGDHDIEVENVSDGFKAVLFEFGSGFYCATCGISASCE